MNLLGEEQLRGTATQNAAATKREARILTPSSPKIQHSWIALLGATFKP